jgi:hydrogenase small subunit
VFEWLKPTDSIGQPFESVKRFGHPNRESVEEEVEMLPMGIELAAAKPLNRELHRRDFLKICSMCAAAVGLPATAGVTMAEAAIAGKKPPVIWLSFQECTGCTETLLRTTAPGLAELILDLISLDYHEALLVPSGHLAEENLKHTMETYSGKFVLIVEGAIPEKDDGIYCKIGGRTAVDILKETAEQAGAIVAIGSCASWGGIPAADPNPTGATGAPMILEGKTVVTIPGCPANPYNLLGTVLQYASFGTLPELDELGRPKWAYGRTIHEHCPRRAHFDAGRFAKEFGDEGHRAGYCLYELGCKGPVTHANCSVQSFGEVVDAWPIGLGHPCVGCTEQKVLWQTAIHETVDIERPTNPDLYPPVAAEKSKIGAVATGVAGLAVGAMVGAGYKVSKSMSEETGDGEGT